MWWLSQEPKMRGSNFYQGACTQGKIDIFHLVRTESPTHAEVRVFPVFVNNNTGLCRWTKKSLTPRLLRVSDWVRGANARPLAARQGALAWRAEAVLHSEVCVPRAREAKSRKMIGNDVLLTDFCIILATRNPPIFRRCRIGLLDIWTFGMFRV